MSAYDLGVSAGNEAIQFRQSLAPLFEFALKARRRDLLSGLIAVLADALDKCQAKDIEFEWTNDRAKQVAGALPAARRLMLCAHCDSMDQDAADTLANLSSAIYGIRDWFTTTVTAAPVPAEPVAPAPPAVTLVQIVGMPERAGQTSIARDGDGAIVGSEFTERDAQEIPT
jgi:ABC-type transporter Mla subunit MlaD